MKKCMRALLFLITAGLLIQFPARTLAEPAEDVRIAMQLVKSKAATLGAPVVKGEEVVAGKTVPALHFGATKMNNNFVLVDEVQKEAGGRPQFSLRAVTSSSAWQRMLGRMTARGRSAPSSTRRVK